MLEKQVEQALTSAVKARGGLALKFVSPGVSGVPDRIVLMPGGRLRMEKLASLVTSGRIDLHKEVTHVFHGKEHVEEALFMMRDKPADLIKPVVIWDD